jgi:indole-3-glycerol phosphate synthase
MILEQLLQATAARVAGLPGAEEYPLPAHKKYCSLSSSLRQKDQGNRIISEIKFASPSSGTIRSAGDPMAFARDFARAGAAALSILTEPVYFHGDPAFIPAIRPHVEIPLLRKDFIIDERQLAESRALGADAVLLIAGVLGDRLEDMVDSAFAYGLEPLVEVHCMEEAKEVLSTNTRLAGINNRDLRTMRTDLSTTMRLAPALRQAGLTVVSESGVIWPCDIRTLRPIADAFLIGTAIMRAPDPVQRLEGFIRA